MKQHQNVTYCTCDLCQSIRRVMMRPHQQIGIQEQPDPMPNQSRPIVDLVIEDMKARKAEGVKRYGTPLQAGNGRDALVDAYHESLDLCMYLRQAIEER